MLNSTMTFEVLYNRNKIKNNSYKIYLNWVPNIYNNATVK